MKAWKYIHIDNRENMMMSGWKLYIYGNSVNDANICSDLIISIVKQYNLTTKIATEYIISRNRHKRIAWGVGVIYLSDIIFSNDLLSSLLYDLEAILSNYGKSGRIFGARSINGKLHCRYELNIPINPCVGIKYEEYLLHYREYGDFNIPNNSILSLIY